MKKLVFLSLSFFCMLAVSNNANAQLLKKLKQKLENAAAAPGGSSNDAVDNGSGGNYELASYENLKKWKPAKNVEAALAKYKFEVGDMEFDLEDAAARSKAKTAEYNKWAKIVLLFDAATGKVFNQYKSVSSSINGSYTVADNKIEIKNGNGTVFEVLEKGKNYCFKVTTSQGTGYLSMVSQDKTKLDKEDAELASAVQLTYTSKFNNKEYYVLSGPNVVSARNDSYSMTYSDITKNKFRYTYIEEHTYTAEDIIFTEFPVEKIKTETFKAVRTSNATYLDFELDGEYDIEKHIQRDNKITIKKTEKVFRVYVGFDASASAKHLAELIVQSSTAAQKAKYDKIKAGFEQSITAMKYEEGAAERAAKASNGAAKENLASITVRSRKNYEFTIEEIPAAGSGCSYQTYTFRTNGTYKFITFCVGSTVKIKGGQTLFVVKKSDNGTEYNVN